MSEWIKCSAQPPEFEVPVWIDGPECAGIGVRSHCGSEIVWGFAISSPYWDNESGWVIDEYDFEMAPPTRWMPLPTPTANPA